MAKDDKKKHHGASRPARAAPKPAPAPARASSTKPSVGQTVTRPAAARTSPPRRADAPRRAARATPKLGDAGAHYTRPNEVPLRPGQTIGYTAGKGYYATTRPSPTKASARPVSRTTKVVALPTRASTQSPLRQRVETRDGKTGIRLFHATNPGGEGASHDKRAVLHASERSVKPQAGAARAYKTRKASSRVDQELARAASAKRSKKTPEPSFPTSLLTLGAASVLKRGATLKSEPFPVGELFLAETSVKASVTGPTVTIDPITGQVVVAWGKQPLLSTSISGVALHGVELTEQLHGFATEVKDGKPVTKQLTKDATVTYHMGVSGPSMTMQVPGGKVTFSLHADQIVIAMTVNVPAPAHSPLTNHPVTLSITTTLSPAPAPKPRSPDPGLRSGQPVTVRKTAAHHSFWDSVGSFFSNWVEGDARLVSAGWHFIEHGPPPFPPPPRIVPAP